MTDILLPTSDFRIEIVASHRLFLVKYVKAGNKERKKQIPIFLESF